MVAFSAAVAHAQYAPGLTPQEQAKPWSVAATIRGFYDDNYLTLPKTIPGTTPGTFVNGARSSYGIEASPSVAYNHSMADTLISASYVYDMQWYQDREGTVDQSHQFNARMDHEFTERYKMSVGESFVIAQEPTVVDTTVISTPLRVAGNNIHNTATIDGTAVLNKMFDVHAGYANSLYAYQQNAGDESPARSYPSYSAILDRIDQTATVDLRWKVLPETTGVLGYQYEYVNYTSPEYVIYPGKSEFTGAFVPGYLANARNSESDFVYVGADQSFSPKLNASIRLGAQYIDYFNDGMTALSPYADASLTYQYMPQSSAQVGVKHIRNATDVAGITGTSLVLDEESTSAYVSVTHKVTSKFTASMMAQAQFSSFDGGGAIYDGKEENFYILNLDFAYHFTPWLAGDAGYNYSKLNSDLSDRSYARDVVYIGIRATY